MRELEETSLEWRNQYIALFLGRDLPALVDTKLTSEQLRRFFLLLANYHGQYWNHTEVAGVPGITRYKTVQRHVEIFKGAYILRELPPFFNNAGKRLRKAPRAPVIRRFRTSCTPCSKSVIRTNSTQPNRSVRRGKGLASSRSSPRTSEYVRKSALHGQCKVEPRLISCSTSLEDPWGSNLNQRTPRVAQNL